MRDATETNEPLANRSATSPPAASSSTVELRSFVDVFGTRPVSRAIALGSVPEAPLARWAAARRAFARRTAARRAAAWRALARRTAALCAFARSGLRASCRARRPLRPTRPCRSPWSSPACSARSSTVAPRSTGPCPRRASAWAGSFPLRVRGRARERAPGGRDRVRVRRRLRPASTRPQGRTTGKEALGDPGRWRGPPVAYRDTEPACSNCFVLLELRVHCAT